MSSDSINYDLVAKVAAARKAAEERLKKAAHRLVPAYPYCALCRRVRRSPRAYYRGRQVCLSCHMRNYSPRFVITEGSAVGLWRKSLMPRISGRAFAKLCGWSHVRQYVVENQHRLQLRSARKVASAFAHLINAGYHSDRLLREWPAFALIAVAVDRDGEKDD